MQTLGERLAQGEQAAFAELYDACADRLQHYLTLRLGSREDADDVVQSTFVRLAQSRRRLMGIENLIAYVFKIARNESADWLRRKGRESLFLSETGSELLFQNVQDDQSVHELIETAMAALAKLTTEQREIVELKIYGKFTFHEIAEIVGVPQGTAATRYRTALERMKGWCLEGPQ
ncbi:MAG: sigW 13 [Planctomycetaceae bacterium]|nr:sigW 13 [Planctomycetaceae bacterium]